MEYSNPLGLTKEEVARKHDAMNRIARLCWAALIIVAELITAESPNWRRDKLKE